MTLHLAASDPLTVPTWITAITTAILAIGAAITAVFAILAFRKQSAEVTILQEQLSDQRKVNQQQTTVLALQAQDLRESLKQREIEAAERRRAQASLVFIWQESTADADQVRNYAMSTGAETIAIEQWPDQTVRTEPLVLAVRVRNSSEQPIYDLALRWRTGPATWKGPERWQLLLPRTEEEFARLAAVPLAEPLDPRLFEAVVEFRDAAGVSWLRRPDGELLERQG